MSATLSAGVNSLILKLDTPTTFYTNINALDIRDDLVKVKVWCSTTNNFTPVDTGNAGANQVFDGLSLSVVITKLANGSSLVAGTTYYVKYAFISDIDEEVYTVSAQLTAVPLSSITYKIIYKRSAFAPNGGTPPDPSPDTPSGWYPDTTTLPTGTNPIWSSTGSKSLGDTNYVWQSPVRVEGVGTPGDSARIAYKTQDQALAAPVITPATTTGEASYPTGWSLTITAPGAGESLWASDGIYNTPFDTVTWGTPYLTQGFPTTIQSDNYNATTAGWQIQRDTGNAYFNNVTARGSLISGTAGQQRIEINVANSNRLEAFRSDNIRFLSIGGSGGTTQDTAVIGISANQNVINPVWIESSANIGSNILSNTLAGANAYSAISTGGGRLFYGSVTNGSNPDAAFRIDINSVGHNKSGFQMNMGTSTGAAYAAGGTGDGYAFDAVTGTAGAAGSKSGIGYFRGIDFPTTSSVITSSGTNAKLQVNFTNLTTAGDLVYTFVIEGTTYSFVLGYDPESLSTLQSFVIAIAAGINNAWQISSTGTLASGSFIITKPVVGVVSGTNSATIGTFTGTFINGTNTTYSSTPTVVRLTPFPNDTTKVLRGDGSWGTVAGSGGYVDRRYNVRDYGAKGDGTTDDTTSIQSAINTAASTGGTVYFPRGLYIISTSLTYTSGATDPGARVHFAGDGVGASLIKQTGTGNGLTIAGNSANPNVYSHIQDLAFVGSQSGQGLSISGAAYAYVEACQFTGWAYGFYGSNFLSSTFSACEFRFNQRGFVVERISSTYSSNPNAITMLNCEVGANSLFGGWILGPGVFTMQGGSFEANGTTVGSSSNWGLRISEPSGSTAIESAIGVSLDGVYFEVNSGIADLWITSSSSKPGVTNNINGCSFLRVGSTYTTNSIFLDSTAGSGFNNVISGCGFKGLGGYSADVSRMTIRNSNNKVQLLGCSFDNIIDAYVPNDINVFESGIRTSSITDLTGNSFAYTSSPLALGTANAGTSFLFAKGDHVHPFSVVTASPTASSTITYNSTTGVLTYTPPTVGNNNATQYQLGYYATTGTALSGTNYLTYEDSSLYINKAGVTDLRLTYNLPGVTAPGMTSTGAALAIASGFNNSTGTYTAGILVSNITDSAPSFSGNASNGTTMNLGTSVATWGKFYWGSATSGISAPIVGGTGFLKQDGTWGTPATSGGTVSSVTGTGSGLGFSLSGNVTTTGSLTLSTPTVAALQSSLGLGGLAYVSSLSNTDQLNNLAIANNIGTTGYRILGTYNSLRTWATMAEVRTALGENGGTPNSTTFLRGDGQWAAPTVVETDTLATVTARGSSTSSAISTGSLSVTGSITASGDITAYSDQKLKTNVKVIQDPFKGMDDIYGVTYDRIDTLEKGMGFIAQNFQEHYPDIVNTNENDTLSLKYLNIIAILWEQNRDLNTRLKTLESKYDATNK